MTKKDLSAWVHWNNERKRWIVDLWDEQYGWSMAHSYKVKDENEDTGYAWVTDMILCEIQDLQKLGYKVWIDAGQNPPIERRSK